MLHKKPFALTIAVALAMLLSCMPSFAVAATIPASDVDPLSVPAETAVRLRGNNTDTGFTFIMNPGSTHGTKGREKQDATPCYVEITTFTVDTCRMYIDGSNGKNGPWTNVTVGGYAVARAEGKWAIHNNVYEYGYKYARLTAWANNGGGVVAGVWSPDSMRTYASMN